MKDPIRYAILENILFIAYWQSGDVARQYAYKSSFAKGFNFALPADNSSTLIIDGATHGVTASCLETYGTKFSSEQEGVDANMTWGNELNKTFATFKNEVQVLNSI